MRIRNNQAQSALGIKACALATIQLDPAIDETKKYSLYPKSISATMRKQFIFLTQRYQLKSWLVKLICFWANTTKILKQSFLLAKTNPKSATEEILPVYTQYFLLLKNDIEILVSHFRADASHSENKMTGSLKNISN
ncbi:hypothetical protein ACO0K0_18080 [Undibacterium sp. SXout11W]|uniref:hypothetical protein n=1 Tax=Undibacterium sp. SXout11W TaxID=3413050 RepID=UPI003BF1E6EB